MLNIGKLAPGGERYYLATVASGVEDYYTGAKEAPGFWLGGASSHLGLEGQVAAEQLRNILGARHPDTGVALTGRMSRRSVPGFDLTFRAPKSVSLLYGLSDAATSRKVRDAHDAAVAAALGYLEEHAGRTRRGHAGAESVPVRGFVAAAFRHRTSRAGDPLLHSHVLVSNIGQAADDGAWRTLDGRGLYTHAKTAGYLYQAQLRAELTRSLGVEWGPVRNGCADLAGVSEDVIRAFSQRRTEILAHMQGRGETSAKAAQVATLATRKRKNHDVEPAALGAQWLARAAALGFGPDEVAALTGQAMTVGPAEGEQHTVDRLLGPTGLTAHTSTFTRRDVIQAWCQELSAGAETAKVLALADRLLHEPEVVALGAPSGQEAQLAAADARYSTADLLAVERRLIARALARSDAGVGIAQHDTVDEALASRHTISPEQADMVRRLTTSGPGVQVVVGKAGTGKTFALDAARAAWQASGLRVIGCALSARAAAELQAGSGIDSYTIHSLLAHLDRPGPHGGLAQGGVVVVDEAGMVGTRTLARLCDHAEAADAKVVLVGDHHQLPEVDAGGAFRALVERLPVIELVANRRQRLEWERAALDELRTGDPIAALAAYMAAGRVVVADSAEAVREQLVSDWWAARSDHDGPGEPGVMIAVRRSDVDDLNDRARMRLAAAGDLTGEPLVTAAGRDFRVGDQIVCLRNDQRLGVLNGTRAHVTAVDHDTGELTATVEQSGRGIVLPRTYLDSGHLAHGYAITGHKAQGMTTGQAWVLGSDAVYREWGYVALSRGRDSNRLYVVAGDDPHDQELHAHGRQPSPDPLTVLTGALGRSRGQQLASQTAPASRDPSGGAAAGGQHGEAVGQLAAANRRLEEARARLHAGGRLTKILSRDATRKARIDIERLTGDLAAWEQRAAELEADASPDLVHDRPDADDDNPRRATQSAEAHAPRYVLDALGACPDDPAARQAWRAGVLAVETYRARWAITDAERPLGLPPAGQLDNSRQREDRLHAAARIQAARRDLAVDNSELVVPDPPTPSNDLSVEIN